MNAEKLWKSGWMGLEYAPVDKFVEFVEHLSVEHGRFAIYHKTTGTDISDEALEIEIRKDLPLIAQGGQETFPFISDPYNQIPGAFGIFVPERRLVYSRRGIPLHKMRDGITWAGNQTNIYYTEGTAINIAQSFVDIGYELVSSPDMVDYRRNYKFTIAGLTSIEAILSQPR